MQFYYIDDFAGDADCHSRCAHRLRNDTLQVVRWGGPMWASAPTEMLQGVRYRDVSPSRGFAVPAPFRQGGQGDGDADCHTSDIGHWFAMTGFFTRSRCKAGRADRGVRPYGLAPTRNASHARGHERRRNRGSTLVYHSMGAFYARPGGGHLHPPRSRTHFPRRFTGRLAAGDRPSLGKAVARTLSDQRAM